MCMLATTAGTLEPALGLDFPYCSLIEAVDFGLLTRAIVLGQRPSQSRLQSHHVLYWQQIQVRAKKGPCFPSNISHQK